MVFATLIIRSKHVTVSNPEIWGWWVSLEGKRGEADSQGLSLEQR